MMSGNSDYNSRHDVDLVVDKSVKQNRLDTDSKMLSKVLNALQESMNTQNTLLSSLVAENRHTSRRKQTVECFDIDSATCAKRSRKGVNDSHTTIASEKATNLASEKATTSIVSDEDILSIHDNDTELIGLLDNDTSEEDNASLLIGVRVLPLVPLRTMVHQSLKSSPSL